MLRWQCICIDCLVRGEADGVYAKGAEPPWANARAEAMGAKRVDIGQGEPTWAELADPEGNEFCILRQLTPEELAER